MRTGNYPGLGLIYETNYKAVFDRKLDTILGIAESYALTPSKTSELLKILEVASMKAQLTRVLQHFHGQSNQQNIEGQLVKLQSHSHYLERLLTEKEHELERLRHQLANYESRLKELEGTDELTTLPNRQAFNDHLNNSLKRAVRLGYCLSVLMIDLDLLHDINLHHGYEIGDKVLVEVGKILRSSVREIDMPARWGGEELVAVLHETDSEGAYVVAERIRKRVSMLEIKSPKTNKMVSLGANMAVASYPRHGHDPQSLLEAVCEALVAHKDQGYNQVLVASY